MSIFGYVVLHPFAGHTVGKLITDAEDMAHASVEFPTHVVRRLLTDAEQEVAALEAAAKAEFRAVVHGEEAAPPVDGTAPAAEPTLTLPQTPAL